MANPNVGQRVAANWELVVGTKPEDQIHDDYWLFNRLSKGNAFVGKSGGDFITAPELSPLYGRALARQVAQALAATGTREVWEFGAGSGALAQQILTQLDAMGHGDVRYRIVDLSGTLRARQQQTLAAFGDRVERQARCIGDRIDDIDVVRQQAAVLGKALVGSQ